MQQGEQDIAERIGKRVPGVFVALLFTFFAYGYLPLFFD